MELRFGDECMIVFVCGDIDLMRHTLPFYDRTGRDRVSFSFEDTAKKILERKAGRSETKERPSQRVTRRYGCGLSLFEIGERLAVDLLSAHTLIELTLNANQDVIHLPRFSTGILERCTEF